MGPRPTELQAHDKYKLRSDKTHPGNSCLLLFTHYSTSYCNTTRLLRSDEMNSSVQYGCICHHHFIDQFVKKIFLSKSILESQKKNQERLQLMFNSN